MKESPHRSHYLQVRCAAHPAVRIRSSHGYHRRGEYEKALDMLHQALGGDPFRDGLAGHTAEIAPLKGCRHMRWIVMKYGKELQIT